MLDLVKLNDFLQFAKNSNMPFYVEHNNFKRMGISIQEQLNDMLEENIIDEITAEECIHNGNIWFVRFYAPNRHGYYEFAGNDFDEVMMSLVNAVLDYNSKIQ